MYITAAQFKAQCLHLMDVVASSREEITITKRGKPVARLIPVVESVKPVFGFLKGHIKEEGDIVSPTGGQWEAETG